MKICTKCKTEKPFEAFWRRKSSTDGYMPHCIECLNLRRLELKKNPLMQLEKEIRSSVILENKLLKRENKRLCKGCKEIFLIDDLVCGTTCKECNTKKANEYYKKGKRIEYIKEYNEKNKEKFKEYGKEYREKNREKIKERQGEYKEKNKEKIKAYMIEYDKEYREKNRERKNAYMREYNEKNRERNKEKKREYNREYIREYRLKKKLEMQTNN